MFIDTSALKELLVSSRVADRAVLDELEIEAKNKGISLSERILATGLISGDDLRRLEARASGVPFIDKLADKVPYTVLARIPEPVARAHNCIAIQETQTGLEVIGLDLAQIAKAKDILGLANQVYPRLGSEALVRRLILGYQDELKNRFGQPLRRLGENLKQEKSEAQITEIVTLLFTEARLNKASRVHLEVTPTETLVRYRIGGSLYDALSTNPFIGERLFEASTEAEIFKPYSYEPIFKHGTDLSKRVVFSRLGQNSERTLADIGLWGQSLDLIDITLRKGGLVPITGSNIETIKELFYTIASEAVANGQSVLMLENKCERYLNHVEQVLVGPDHSLTPAETLRRLLPQDFDVLIIDEIDKPETMALAVVAAARGLAVFVGVASSGLEDLISKALKLAGDSYILSIVARGFLRVEGVRALSAHFIPAKLSPEELKDLSGFIDMNKIADSLGFLPDSTLEMGKFKTRRAVVTDNPLLAPAYYVSEVAVVDKVVETMIRDLKTSKEIVKQARNNGNLSLGEEAFTQAVLGKIDLNEAIAIVRRRG
ncbi:MAG: ATPase, T2SS/T4P/T4SS family [Patescibacteria group bacterium]